MGSPLFKDDSTEDWECKCQCRNNQHSISLTLIYTNSRSLEPAKPDWHQLVDTLLLIVRKIIALVVFHHALDTGVFCWARWERDSLFIVGHNSSFRNSLCSTCVFLD